jgi:hypothetical protein
MDWIGNAHYGVVRPYTYLSRLEWNHVFDEPHLRVGTDKITWAYTKSQFRGCRAELRQALRRPCLRTEVARFLYIDRIHSLSPFTSLHFALSRQVTEQFGRVLVRFQQPCEPIPVMSH